MKLMNLNKEGIQKFFKTIDKCNGDVDLLIKDQMELNLKSKLSQYVALVGLFSQADVPEIEIRVHDKRDVMMLINFMVQE